MKVANVAGCCSTSKVTGSLRIHRHYISLFIPESPQAGPEGSRSLSEVDTSKVHVAALVIAGGADDLIAPQLEPFAKAIDASFVVNPVWTKVTEHIDEWLSRLPRAGAAS